MAKKNQDNNGDKKGNENITKNVLDALLGGYKDSHYGHLEPKSVIISSGSLKIDSVITVRTGTTIRMGGPAETGKTSQSFLFAANYMNTMPKAKTIYVNAEAKLSEELQKNTGLKFVWSGDEWEYGTVFVLETNVCETVGDMLVSLLKTAYEQGEHICIIVDSIDMLVSIKDLDKKMHENKSPAGVNKLTKDLFRKISHLIRGFDALLIMITQYSATFNPDPYSKTAPQLMEGNNTHAINHQCSCGLYYRQRGAKSYILEDDKAQPDPSNNKILGVNAKVELKKTSTSNTGYTIEVPIKLGRIGNAVWNEKEVADLIIAFQMLVPGKGSWWNFDADILKEAAGAKITLKETINGMKNIYAYLEEDKNAYLWLKKKVVELIRIHQNAEEESK